MRDREFRDAGAERRFYEADVDAVRFVTAPFRRRVKVVYDGLHPRTALPLGEDVARLVRKMTAREMRGMRK